MATQLLTGRPCCDTVLRTGSVWGRTCPQHSMCAPDELCNLVLQVSTHCAWISYSEVPLIRRSASDSSASSGGSALPFSLGGHKESLFLCGVRKREGGHTCSVCFCFLLVFFSHLLCILFAFLSPLRMGSV